MSGPIRSFRDFYPFYLAHHSDRRSRALHYLGTVLAVGALVCAAATGRWWVVVLAPVLGYGFAWAGHVLFEKNTPLSFHYPWMSLRADFVLLLEAATGRFRLPAPPQDGGTEEGP